jgi:hypothetical protein
MSERRKVEYYGKTFRIPDTAPSVVWEEINYEIPVREELIRDAASAILLTRGIENPTNQEIADEVEQRKNEFIVAKRAGELERVRKELARIMQWLDVQGENDE